MFFPIFSPDQRTVCKLIIKYINVIISDDTNPDF